MARTRKARFGGAWVVPVRKVRIGGAWVPIGAPPVSANPYVRTFDGVDDEVITGLGACADMTHGTLVFLMKRTATTSVEAVFSPHSSDGTFRGEIGTSTGTAWMWYSGTAATGGTVVLNRWHLVVARKASGLVIPRFSIYDYTAGTWQHAAGSGTRNNWTAPGAGGYIKMSTGGNDFPTAKIAARAAWSNALPFAADTTGDAAIEAAGLHLSAQAWKSKSPSAMWLFNQADPATPVADLIGGGHQISVTGTAVDTTDPPPGFNFAIS